MHRIAKILWMIFIFWMVFFIIRDEKWYKIWFENGHIVFDEVEKKSKFTENDKLRTQLNPNVIYKNSDLIQINYEFENPKELRYAKWVDKERIAQIKEEKKIEERLIKKQAKISTWHEEPILNNSNISSLFEKIDNQNINETGEKVGEREDNKNIIKNELTWNKIREDNSNLEIWDKIDINTWIVKNKIRDTLKNERDSRTTTWNHLNRTWTNTEKEQNKVEVIYPFEKYNLTIHNLNLKRGGVYENSPFDVNVYTWMSITSWKNSESLLNFGENSENEYQDGFWETDNSVNSQNLNNMNTSQANSWSKNNINTWKWNESEDVLYIVEKYDYIPHWIDIKKAVKINPLPEKDDSLKNYTINKDDIPQGIDEKENETPALFKVEKYQLNKHYLNLRKWVAIMHEFVVNDTENNENWFSDSVLENLLQNEEIDINTLESENDEFLQKIFEKTKDINIMNLIVETYLNEYQFVKAKKFIENLPENYSGELKPSLNLRVAFNSFPLSSKTNNENLTSLIQNYSTKNEISTEDQNRYLWVVALMNRNYDKFFEISKWFTSERNKTFSIKLQGYKDQTAKQMWMPEYYFDTLVSLELFNQWLFQPAKILALYSLQQNSEYILPYQILAYANFLTNSWDTSIEYLKKLVDIDPNNAEKYRFLIWVAFYWNEKYEQSVVMLSMIKDEKLRLDTQRYLINDYLKLNQKNKLISSRNKLLGYENLVASDFYTYFYETFFHPYSQWEQFQLYAYDTELANKMLRVCSMILKDEEKAVCTYGTIGRNIALWQFDGLEQYLLNLATEYPQWYLYQALWDYYIQQWDLEKAKAYLLKAISLTQKKSERSQIKKLLQDAI